MASDKDNSRDATPILIVGGLALLLYLLWNWKPKLGPGGLLPGAGTGGAGTAAALSTSTGATNPEMASIGLTSAYQAGSTAVNSPLEMGSGNTAATGGTNPFTITSMSGVGRARPRMSPRGGVRGR